MRKSGFLFFLGGIIVFEFMSFLLLWLKLVWFFLFGVEVYFVWDGVDVLFFKIGLYFNVV